MTQRLEDWSAWVGTWPFGLARTMSLPDLRAVLDRHGIDHAHVSPVGAVLAEDPMVANRELADAAPDDGRVSVTPVVNPTLAGWERDLAGLQRGSDVRAVRLMPTWHGWGPESACADGLLERIAGMGCTPIVQLRMLDERGMPPFIRLPEVDAPAVASWIGNETNVSVVVCGSYVTELGDFARLPNTRLDISFVESDDTLVTAREVIPAERLVFGSLAPLLEVAAGLAKRGNRANDTYEGHPL